VYKGRKTVADHMWEMNILSYDSKHVMENITEYKGQKQYKQ